MLCLSDMKPQTVHPREEVGEFLWKVVVAVGPFTLQSQIIFPFSYISTSASDCLAVHLKTTVTDSIVLFTKP